MTDKCNPSYQTQIAFIDKNLSFNDLNSININDYLRLPNEEQKQVYCNKGHELISVRASDRARAYFRHRNQNDMSGHPMTVWHVEWQGHYAQTEIPFEKKTYQIKDRIADIRIQYCNDRGLALSVRPPGHIEIQHSRISEQEVQERKHDYDLHDVDTMWIVDGNETVDVKRFANGRIWLKFKLPYWKYKSFCCYNIIYLNIGDEIFKINPSDVKSHMIDVHESVSKQVFILATKDYTYMELWSKDKPVQTTLTVCQDGAGSGKTYGTWKNINDTEHIRDYILLQKAHSAKDISVEEMKNLLDRLDDEGIPELSNLKIDVKAMYNIGKTYIFPYTNNKTGYKGKIIIGVIDAFLWRIANSTPEAKEMFESIMKNVINDWKETTKVMQNGSIKFDTKLNKEVMLCIDEVQDLSPNYIESVAKIMRETYMEVRIVGDRMQSIFKQNNVLTFLKDHENELPNIIINRVKKEYVCRRFERPSLMSFVNNIVNFEKYDECPMKSINPNYVDIIETESAIKVFQMIASFTKDDGLIEEKIEEIIGYVNDEVEKYNYLPRDFIFIFGFITKNDFAVKLQSALNEFWMKKFQDSLYIENVLSKDKYWKDHYLNEDTFYIHAFLHKHEEGKSINLKESEQSSRLVSIHTSKGDGRNVSFTFFNTAILKIYSYTTDNIQYESLINVAHTRSKRKQYIALEHNDDEYFNRIKEACKKMNIDIEADFKIEPDLGSCKKNIRYNKVYTSILNDYEPLRDSFDIIKYNDTISDKKKQAKDLEWSDHTIKFSIMQNKLLFTALKEIGIENYNTSPIKAIFSKIAETPVYIVYNWKKYFTIISIYNRDQDDSLIYYPVHNLSKKGKEYIEYCKEIVETMKWLQKELSRKIKNTGYPDIPYDKDFIIRHVVLYYMVKTHEEGQYSDITISDVYRIIDKIKKSSDDVHSNMIKSHLSEVNKVSTIYKNFETSCEKKYKINPKEIKWLLFHNVTLNTNFEQFKFSQIFPFIGNTDTHVIHIIIKPQYNKLNYADIMMSSVLEHFLIMNSSVEHKENYKRYNGKKILSCIFSLDNEEPIFLEWEFTKKNKDLITDLLKISIKDLHASYHNLVFKFLKHCEETLPEDETIEDYIEIKVENAICTGKECKTSLYIKDRITKITGNLEDGNKLIEENVVGRLKNDLNKQLKNLIRG